MYLTQIFLLVLHKQRTDLVLAAIQMHGEVALAMHQSTQMYYNQSNISCKSNSILTHLALLVLGKQLLDLLLAATQGHHKN